MDTFEIPIFPLQAVLFPGGRLPLRIFEQRYMDMAKDALRDNALFGVSLIKEGDETGAPALPEDIGCLARIVDWDMHQLGVLHVVIKGLQRYRILEQSVEKNGLIRAQVVTVTAEPDQKLSQANTVCSTVLQHIIEQVGETNFHAPLQLEDAVWVGYRLSEVLPLKLAVKQQLLQMNDSVVRIQVLHKFLIQQGLSI